MCLGMYLFVGPTSVVRVTMPVCILKHNNVCLENTIGLLAKKDDNPNRTLFYTVIMALILRILNEDINMNYNNIENSVKKKYFI